MAELTMERLKAETDVAFAGVRVAGYRKLVDELVASGKVLPVVEWGWFCEPFPIRVA